MNLSGTFEKPSWKVYRRFLFMVLLYYITDVLWGVLETFKLNKLLFADTTIYYAAMSAGILFWAEYIVSYLNEKNVFERLLIYISRTLSGLIACLVIINIFTPVLFTVDKYSIYHALPARYGMLICQILLLFLIAFYAGRSYFANQSGKKKKYRTLTLFGLIMTVFLFIQLWFPFLPLYTIAYMLSTCLLHTFVINDEKEEYQLQVEEAAKITELKASISSLLDNMPSLSFSKNAENGVYLACNQAFAEYAHRQSPEEVIGLTDGEIFDPVTAKHFMEDDYMALTMDMPYIFYEDVPDAAGNQRQFQTTKLKFHDASGRLCILGMCQDVTDLVRIQHENATTKEAYEKARSTSIIYTHIAQALAHSYTDLYYVNLDTEEYIEYRPEEGTGALTEVRRDWHFFEECKIEAEMYVHPDDRAAFVKALDRRTLLDALNRNNTFLMTYRLLSENGATYVNMKISRMEDDERFIIIGITDIDEQMKQRRAAERMKEEQIAYARLNALTGQFICIYIVVPETGRYREYSSSAGFDTFTLPKEGMDFFGETRENSRSFVYPADLGRFLSSFTREGVLEEISRSGIFSLSYRLVIGGIPTFVQLKAAMVEEKEGNRLIVGINDINSQVRQEENYAKRLAQAQSKANIDALTGVKNRHAYLEAEEQLNRQIAEHRHPEFAIVILDVNDLKKVNDNEGHQAGDEYLRSACKIICNTFKHSPVFRVSGDEFAVISRGSDYASIEELIGRMDDHNTDSIRSGGIVIARGMAKFENDSCVGQVYERADQKMYENKTWLKSIRPVQKTEKKNR